MKRIVLDGEQLNRAAGVEFGVSDLLMLADLAAVYNERFRGEPAPDFALADSPIAQQLPATSELEARRAFVDAVWGIWNECRRLRCRRRKRDQRRRNYQRLPRFKATEKHFINLMGELLAAVGETPTTKTAINFRHDLNFLRTGRERAR